MDVYWIDESGLQRRSAAEIEQLKDKPDGVLWVDIPLCQSEQALVLKDVFGFADIAVRDCLERNHIAKMHLYGDHVFVVVHAPHLSVRGGHVHYIELDQFIGHNFLVTVHGPLNPVVVPGVAHQDTRRVVEYIESGRIRPTTGMELAHAIVSSLVRRETDLVAELAKRCGSLEREVTDQVSDRPKELLEGLFAVNHELLAVRTLASQAADTFGHIARNGHSLTGDERALATDLGDRFSAVRSMAHGQREFIQGVIEFFQTRTTLDLTLAAEKQNDQMKRVSAWVGVVAVPSAVTGFFGQNVPYPGFGETSGFILSLVIMLGAALTLYLIFRRNGMFTTESRRAAENTVSEKRVKLRKSDANP